MVDHTICMLFPFERLLFTETFINQNKQQSMSSRLCQLELSYFYKNKQNIKVSIYKFYIIYFQDKLYKYVLSITHSQKLFVYKPVRNLRINLTRSMQNNLLSKQEYLDAKTIPKFQFELLDEELVKVLRELCIQTNSHEKIIVQYKKELSQKLTLQNYVDSLKLLEGNLKFNTELESMVSSQTKKNSNFNDPAKPVITSTLQLSHKFNLFSEILTTLNSKFEALQKKVSQSELKTNKNVKQKVSSVEQQLALFVKDYRSSFKDLGNKFEENKLFTENMTKQVENKTIWKINECSKRLDDRPNVQMVKKTVLDLQSKLTKLIQSGGGTSNLGSGYGDTTKIQQDLMKLQKLVDFNSIQIEAQVKNLNDKLSTSYMSLKSYADERINITKQFQHLNIFISDAARKIKTLQTQLINANMFEKQTNSVLNTHNQQIQKINQKVNKFTKSDEFAKLMQKIDPHEICRLSTLMKSLQQKSLMTDQRIQSLNSFFEAVRSKMQFWNVANGENPEKSSNQNLSVEMIAKIIKEQISDSDFKIKMVKFEHQLLDLVSLKDLINDLAKKIARAGKDNDLLPLKYEIQGVQQYFKRQILLLTNKLNSLEISFSDTKRRPLSARGKGQDSRLISSISTKKLVPVNCISCHQSNTILSEKQRRTIFNSKLVMK